MTESFDDHHGRYPHGRCGSIRRTDRDHRRELRYRATDYRVRQITGRWPLSVSTDRIGVAAMRCASLLDSLAAQGAPVDRCGSDHAFDALICALVARAARRHGAAADG